MIFLKDLGMRLATIGSRRPVRYGLYECPTCHNTFECITNAKRVLPTTQCKVCGSKTAAQPRLYKSAETFIERATIIHDRIYDYSRATYTNRKEVVTITCHTHGAFSQTPSNHLAGHGCPSCATYGFNYSKPAILYYLKVVDKDTIVYKIGVTNRSVEKRFHNNDLAKISILKVWEHSLGIDAVRKEREIVDMYREYRYIGEPILSSGNTELFIKDILELDQTVEAI